MARISKKAKAAMVAKIEEAAAEAEIRSIGEAVADVFATLPAPETAAETVAAETANAPETVAQAVAIEELAAKAAKRRSRLC